MQVSCYVCVCMCTCLRHSTRYAQLISATLCVWWCVSGPPSPQGEEMNDSMNEGGRRGLSPFPQTRWQHSCPPLLPPSNPLMHTSQAQSSPSPPSPSRSPPSSSPSSSSSSSSPSPSSSTTTTASPPSSSSLSSSSPSSPFSTSMSGTRKY